MGDSSPVAEELRQMLHREISAGASMSAIAERAGITTGQVSRLAAAKRAPTLASAERVARALGYELVIRRRR